MKERMVTRTLKVTEGTVVGFIGDDVIEEAFCVQGYYDDEPKLLKAISQVLFLDRYAYVKNSSRFVYRYTMSEIMFMNTAQPTLIECVNE